MREAQRVGQRGRRVRVVAQPVLRERLGQRAVAGQLVLRRVDAALELVRAEPVRALELARVLDELLGRAHLGHVRPRVAEEQVGGELDLVAQPAAEQVVHRHAEPLADQVQARELDRRVQLDAVVVQRRGRVADLLPQRLELERVVAAQARAERLEGGLGAVAAAAHLAQADQPVGGLDLDQRAHEAAPVRAVGVQQRRLERDGDGGRADVGDLEAGGDADADHERPRVLTPSAASSPPSTR